MRISACGVLTPESEGFGWHRWHVRLLSGGFPVSSPPSVTGQWIFLEVAWGSGGKEKRVIPDLSS